MQTALITQSLVLTLNLMVTYLLWLNYRNSFKVYLALAAAAGMLEILRQLIDTLIAIQPGVTVLYIFTSSLQFLSAVVLLSALFRMHTGAVRLTRVITSLIVTYVCISSIQQWLGFDATVNEWYLFYLPLLLTQILIVKQAWQIRDDWPPSRIFLLISSAALLIIRGWLPYHMAYDQLFYTVYYLEVLLCPITLLALVFSAMEEAHQQSQSLLADRVQAVEDLQFILDHSLDVILVTDESGTLLSWNQRAEEQFGHTSFEAIGKLNLNKLLTTQNALQPLGGTSEFQAKFYHANGSEVIVKVRTQSVQRGDQVYRTYILQDISAQQELVKQQAALQRQVERGKKIESLGVLAGGIAHDFNNMLMGLFGNISMARNEISPDHRAWPILEEAEKSMSRATNLTGHLLTFATGGEPVRDHIHLVPLIQETVRFDLSGSNVKPVFQQQHGLWLARVDGGQVQQIFSNLTVNANHAMPDGGHLYITFENEYIHPDTVPDLKPGKYIKATVRDEGLGIEAKYLDQIFEPYFSTKQTGNGLGLATTYSIINRHGGHITVDSIPGEGTTFTIHLPASDFPTSPETEQDEHHRTSERQSGRVLLLDDDEMVCNVVTKMLDRLGFSVETVASGEQVKESYRQSVDSGQRFDVVILDLTIRGGIGGEEVVKDILRIDKNATVIVSSGYAESPVLANYEDYGFKGVVTKPYTMHSLEKVLHRINL